MFAADAGRSLIWVGLALFLLSFLAWSFGERSRLAAKIGGWGFLGGGLCLLGAFISLGALFAGDQFQYEYVFARGDASTDLKYKIAGIWAGQEGSFLLWACTSALFGMVVAPRTGLLRRWFTIPFALFLASLCGILAYETPFTLIPEVGNLLPPTGSGLTPSLQNYWVVIHPPTIFMGFGSLTVPFCWAIAAMMRRDPDSWVAGVRPWVLLSVALLGVGLCMGGFWAYETLGWGGFWMWDPVENVSFVPWLGIVMLVHGLIVQTAKKQWMGMNLLLAGLPFLAFVYGTFLTRSGFLADTSVHSFAEMEQTAHKVLLGFFAASAVGFVGLWLWRGRPMGKLSAPAPAPGGVYREATYRWGGALLGLTAAATAIGMSVPMFMALSGRQPAIVEEHVYHLVLSWFFVPTIVLMAIAPFVGWRPQPLRGSLAALLNPLSLAIGTVGVALLLLNRSHWTAGAFTTQDTVSFPFGIEVWIKPWVFFLFGICVFAGYANLWRVVALWKRGRSSIGGFVAHVGIAVLMAGLIVSRGFERKSGLALVEKDGSATALGYTITYKGRTIERGDPEQYLYDRNNKMEFDVRGHGESFTASPGLFYVRNMQDPESAPNQMLWPSIHRALDHDIYLTLRSEEFDIGKAQMLLPGETKDFSGLAVTYKEFTMVGKPGAPGTRFGAKLHIETPDSTPPLSTDVHPELEITKDGLVPRFAGSGQGVMASLQRIDAATKGALVQLHRERPAYPIEIYYKPLTLFVWLGTGILAFGSLWAAWARRPRRSQSEPTPTP